MYTAMVTLCLGLSLGQPGNPADAAQNGPASVADDVLFLHSHTFRLPFKTTRQADIRELILYESPDRGATWQKVAVIPGSEEAFTYSVEADGQYWYQVAITDKNGKQYPADVRDYQARPERVVKRIIHSIRPLVNIKAAERHGEDIAVAWEVYDLYPDWSTFKLEYQIYPSAEWKTVPVAPAFKGQARIQPGNLSPVKIRLQLGNRAKNMERQEVDVPGSGVQPPVFPPAAVPISPRVTPIVSPPPPDLGQGTTAVARPPLFPRPPVFAPGQENAGASAIDPPSTGGPAGHPPVAANPIAQSERWVPNVPPGPDANTRLVSGPDPAAAPRRRPLPDIRYVNTREVSLAYELTKVGPSGVGSVDLWWTKDDGQTWQKYADDPTAKGPGRHERLLKLETETDGVFGFRMVVRSRAGLGHREPRPGDVPDIRIELDQTPPEVKLWFVPVPDPQCPNAVILTWTAVDKNLAPNPVRLEWAERREGPWEKIAANLPNTGRYSWKLPDNLPVEVFLRVIVSDLAGNVGVAATKEPQLVDLSEPEGKLIGVTPR